MQAQASQRRFSFDSVILNALLWDIPTSANATMLLFLFRAKPAGGPNGGPLLFFCVTLVATVLAQVVLGTRFPKLSPFKNSEFLVDPALTLADKLERLRQDKAVWQRVLLQMSMLALLSVLVMTVHG